MIFRPCYPCSLWLNFFLAKSKIAGIDHTSEMMYTLRMNNNWKVYYYQKEDGTHPVKEYIDSLSVREKAKTLAFIELLQNTGPSLKRPYADLLRDGIHELRLKLTGTQVRILYFFCFQNAIVLTNVFEKHTEAVPESEINTALNCRADFYERFSEKDFQEDEK